MRIAILGTRGIPACYGGFETFAEELSTRLVARGHDVTVYCRPNAALHGVDTYRGVRLVTLPVVRHKYLETIQHTCFSALHAAHARYDIALFCNAANAVFTPIVRRTGTRVALNVDGLERNRKKWNVLGRAWYRFSETLSTFCPDEIVTDAAFIRDYYRTQYGRSSWFIAYGAPLGKVSSASTPTRLGLEPDKYFLSVTRFEPENNPLLIRRAFERVDTPLRLALIGDAPYAPSYVAQIKDTTDARVVIPGAIYGPGYHELQSHCFAYVHATEVGGTHPALIEAMGRGALILYLDTAENREVAGGAGLAFHDEASLAERMRETLSMSDAERDALRHAAMERVRERYSWDAVTDEYLRLFTHMLA